MHSIKTTRTVSRVRKKMMILVFLQVREKQRIRSQLKRRRKLSIKMAQSRLLWKKVTRKRRSRYLSITMKRWTQTMINIQGSLERKESPRQLRKRRRKSSRKRRRDSIMKRLVIMRLQMTSLVNRRESSLTRLRSIERCKNCKSRLLMEMSPATESLQIRSIMKMGEDSPLQR